MASWSIRVEQSVQVSAFCHQRVAIGIQDIPEDATDEYFQNLLAGPVRRGFTHLSKAVTEKCDDMRHREQQRMIEETKNMETHK